MTAAVFAFYRAFFYRAFLGGKNPSAEGSAVREYLCADVKHVQKAQDAGGSPVLAHVERYECLWRGDRLRELISRGVLLQSNAQEVEGGLLNRMTRRVAGACRRGEIDFVASDMHNMNSRPPLSDRQLRWFRKNTDAAYFRQLFGDGIRERLADRIQI